MRTTFQVDDIDVVARLRALKSAGGDLRKPYARIGAYLQEEIHRLFDVSRTPWGEPWRPLKYREGKPLRDTGVHLQQTIGYEVRGESLEVGTRTPWAWIHQFGGRAGRNLAARIPARPFLPVDQAGHARLPADWKQGLLGMMREHIEESVR